MTLAELVAAERARQSLSLRMVAERSGGLVAHTTVHDVETGRRAEVGDDVIDGLAKALDLPVERVQRAAGIPVSDVPGEPFVLPRRANRLTRKERDHVLELVDLLLERRRR